MGFCERCGTQLGTGAVFCSSCGKPIGAAAAVPLAGLGGTFEPASLPPAAAPDDLAGLSEKWRLRFEAIEKAGGARARWWRLPGARDLTWKEKRLVTSNLWAFVFGPLYCLYLGMWRKAITLTLVVLVIDVILGMAGDALNVPLDKSLWIVSALTFKQCGNVDYYRKTVLKLREWW